MIVGKVFVHQESAGCSAWQVPIVRIVSKLIFKQNWTGLWIEHMHKQHLQVCQKREAQPVEEGEVGILLIFGAFFIIYMLKRGGWAFYQYLGHFSLSTCWRERGGHFINIRGIFYYLHVEAREVGRWEQKTPPWASPTQTSTLLLDSNVESSSGVSLRITTIDVVSNPYE